MERKGTANKRNGNNINEKKGTAKKQHGNNRKKKRAYRKGNKMTKLRKQQNRKFHKKERTAHNIKEI